MLNLKNAIHISVNAIVTIFMLLVLASCASKLKVIDDLSATAFDCIQDYAPEADPMVRKTGKPAPVIFTPRSKSISLYFVPSSQ